MFSYFTITERFVANCVHVNRIGFTASTDFGFRFATRADVNQTNSCIIIVGSNFENKYI